MDRGSARDRQVKLNDRAPDYLAFLLVVIFAGVTSVLAYYFGSSKSSQVKTQMLGSK